MFYQADGFVSLHYDSNPNKEISGITSFYYDKQRDYSFASAIHNRLIDNTGFRDRGIEKQNYFVLRANGVPSVLIELGFLSNKKEERIINSVDYQEKATDAMLSGMISYFKAN
jgi:N-acetylmuramoyl-L-alanine amidase